MSWLRQANTALENGLLDRYTAMGRWEAEQLDGNVPMLDGEILHVSSADGFKVNGASILRANIESNNGIIHVLGSVFPIDVKTIRG